MTQDAAQDMLRGAVPDDAPGLAPGSARGSADHVAQTMAPGAGGPALECAVHTLAGLLREENAALEAMDFGRAGAVLAAKHAAADALAAAWRSANPAEMPQDALLELGKLAEANRLLLNRALRVQRRVLDLVARAARAAEPAARYGASGRVRPANQAPRALTTRA